MPSSAILYWNSSEASIKSFHQEFLAEPSLVTGSGDPLINSLFTGFALLGLTSLFPHVGFLGAPLFETMYI